MKHAFLKFLITSFLIAIICCISGTGFLIARAAEIDFQDDGNLAVNHLYEVVVTLNPDTQSINAIEGTITFPEQVLEVQHILSDNSIIGEWLETPQVKNNSILFSGIIPHGFSGVMSPFNKNSLPGTLFTIIFRVKNTAVGSLDGQDIKAYANDGKSSPILVTVKKLVLDPTLHTTDIDSSVVTTLPEDFTPELAKDKNAFDNKYFVIFSTRAEDGIDHYEIEENNTSSTTDAWIQTTSPYVLQDQTLHSYIFIKAVSVQGNQKIIMLPPHPELTTPKIMPTAIILTIIVIIVLLMWFIAKKI